MTRKCGTILFALFMLASGAVSASTDTFDAEGVSSITAWLRSNDVMPNQGFATAIPENGGMRTGSSPVLVAYDYDAETRWVSIKGPPAELRLRVKDDVVRLRCRVGVVVEVSQKEPITVNPIRGARECMRFEGDVVAPSQQLSGALGSITPSIDEQMQDIASKLFRSVVSLSHPPPPGSAR